MTSEIQVEGLGFDGLIGGEWLATNGIGGYASSTIPCLNTRKYHGLLVAAMSPPVRRMVLLSRIEETLWIAGTPTALDCNEYPGVVHPQGHQLLRAFRADPCPTWIYAAGGWRLRKQLRLLPGQNAVVVSYTLLEGPGPIDLEIRPLLALRGIHELTFQRNGGFAVEDRSNRHHRIPPTAHTPEFFFAHSGRFSERSDWYLNQIYRQEVQRGYAGLEDLWTPGIIRLRLLPGHAAHFVGSAEPIELGKAIELADGQFPSRPSVPSPDPIFDAFRRAAEQFVVSVSAGSNTGPVPLCVTGFCWPAPSGRDMLIAFTGLFLVTGRDDQARSLLLAFASQIRGGLMPSRFPEEGAAPEYNGADVSLWFINAVWDYFRYTSDGPTTKRLLDAVCQIIESYRHGSDLGITVDADALLASRAPGIPTSWMDAKVNDWVITPRVGRPVELNALWYNAVRIGAELCRRFGRNDRSDSLLALAGRTQNAFNIRFWNPTAACCFDVVEEHGNDPSVRPNQLLTISLPFAVLSPDRHAEVLDRVRVDLLTPHGIRTLSHADPGYLGRYGGGIVTRDRAYHNGAAFPWLLGPYIAALLKVRGRGEASRQQARELLGPSIEFLMGRGLGQLRELFDGDMPQEPGGCIASAPAIAEVLRCYAQDVLGLDPVMAASEAAPLKPAPTRTRRARNRA